jgi:hypothetical protein
MDLGHWKRRRGYWYFQISTWKLPKPMIFVFHSMKFLGWNADDADYADFHGKIICGHQSNPRIQRSVIEHG